MSGKHIDLTARVDGLPRGYITFRTRPAHKAQSTPADLLTAAYEADEDGIPWSYGYDGRTLEERGYAGPEDDEDIIWRQDPDSTDEWRFGEIPPDLPTHTWHDVWAGNPETDKAWAKTCPECDSPYHTDGNCTHHFH